MKRISLIAIVIASVCSFSCKSEYGLQDWSTPGDTGITLKCQVYSVSDEPMTWPSSSQIGLYCPQTSSANVAVTMAASTAGSEEGNFYTGIPWGEGEHTITVYWPYKETSTESALVGSLSKSVVQSGSSMEGLSSMNLYVGKTASAEVAAGENVSVDLKPLFDVCEITVNTVKYVGCGLDRVTLRSAEGNALCGVWSYDLSSEKLNFTEGNDNLSISVSGLLLSEEPLKLWYLMYDSENLSENVDVEVTLSKGDGNVMLTGNATLTASLALDIDTFASTSVEDDSINLADPDADGLQETANCYVAGQPGKTYRFPATIMGNGKTTLPDNSFVVSTSGAAPGITPSALSPVSARILWQTGKSLVRDVKIKNGYVYFTLNGEEGGTLTPGNVLIAVYSGEEASGDMLWSWHIWITDADLDGNLQTWKVHGDVPANSVLQNPQLMDRNLGALESRGYEVTGTNLDHGLIYQWGRKDPFVGADDSKWGSTAMKITYDYNDKEIGGYQAADAYSSAAKWTYVNKIHMKREDLGKYPMVFYYTGTTKNDQFWLDEVCHDLWGCPDYGLTGNKLGEKTIYDPCPPGYRVMNAYAMTGATTALAGGKFDAVASGSNLVNYSSFSQDKASLQVKYDGANIAYIPANGITYFEKENFPVTRTGTYGYLWSASLTNTHSARAYRVHFDTANFNSMGNGYVSYGHGVRCEKII